jgi:hypothetical protein
MDLWQIVTANTRSGSWLRTTEILSLEKSDEDNTVAEFGHRYESCHFSPTGHALGYKRYYSTRLLAEIGHEALSCILWRDYRQAS